MNKKQNNVIESLKKIQKEFVYIPKQLQKEFTKLNQFICASEYGDIKQVEYPILKADGTISKRKKIINKSRVIIEGEIGELLNKRVIIK